MLYKLGFVTVLQEHVENESEDEEVCKQVVAKNMSQLYDAVYINNGAINNK